MCNSLIHVLQVAAGVATSQAIRTKPPSCMLDMRVAHLLNGLEIGGKERVALCLAVRGNQEGDRHELVLFDKPFRSAELDFHPGHVATHFLRRGPGIDLAFAWRLSRLLNQIGADVVHAHNDTAMFYAVLASLFRADSKPRVVATFHTWPTHPTRAARYLNRLAGRRACCVSASSELADRLLQTGWLNRCLTVWNGVDLREYTPAGPKGRWREKLGLDTRQVLVGHVARFDPIKRHVDLLDAAKLLRNTMPEVRLVLVGRGPVHDEICRQGLDLPNVLFLSSVAEMAPFLRSLDMMVLCSDHEVAPLVLLEAMACGLPVIATGVGGVPHLLDYGRAGILIPPRDPPALASAIERLAHAPEERARFSAAAENRAAAFSFEVEWAAYRALYAGPSYGKCR